MSSAPRRAVVYFFWGPLHLSEALRSAATVRRCCDLPIVAITDVSTSQIMPPWFDRVVVFQEPAVSLLAKARLIELLPDDYDSFLFLDTDTEVLEDVTYGFEKAERFGIAGVMAPHYSLDHFLGFGAVMSRADVPHLSQLQYNTGVLFFVRRPDVDAVFRKWCELASSLGPRCGYTNDQPFFTLALEMLHFNAFTLSPAYNYRALGELVSGIIRIWHSHMPAPSGVNTFGSSWPPRRFQGAQLVEY